MLKTKISKSNQLVTITFLKSFLIALKALKVSFQVIPQQPGFRMGLVKFVLAIKSTVQNSYFCDQFFLVLFFSASSTRS